MNESDRKRDVRHHSRDALPMRKRGSNERKKRTEIGRGKAVEATIPEIQINAADEASTEVDNDDENPFISIGIDLGTT